MIGDEFVVLGRTDGPKALWRGYEPWAWGAAGGTLGLGAIAAVVMTAAGGSWFLVPMPFVLLGMGWSMRQVFYVHRPLLHGRCLLCGHRSYAWERRLVLLSHDMHMLDAHRSD